VSLTAKRAHESTPTHQADPYGTSPPKIVRPNGREEILLDVPKDSFNWQVI
jgi:hypothetical protein